MASREEGKWSTLRYKSDTVGTAEQLRTVASPELVTLVLLAVLLFTLMATGHQLGLW